MGTISLQIPQSGSPRSTEEAKVSSDLTTIETVINGGLDTNNLSPTAGITAAQLAPGAFGWKAVGTAGNYTASSGDSVDALHGTTVTLPTATAGRVVSITADGAASAAAPVTVSGGATPIFGQGMPGGPTSFLLADPLASAILVAFGTFWCLIAGQQNTGWTAPTFSNGWTDAGAPNTPVGYRKIGDIVYFRGIIVPGSPTFTAFVMPAGFRPVGDSPMGSPSGATFLMFRSASGNVTPLGNVQFSLEGFSYSTTL